MARCSAVINSSTGFSHVLIIGSGEAGPPSLPSRPPPPPSLCHVDALCRSGWSGVCRDAAAGGLHRPHRHVHHGQAPPVRQTQTEQGLYAETQTKQRARRHGNGAQRERRTTSFPISNLDGGIDRLLAGARTHRSFAPFVLRCSNLLPSVFREHSRAAEAALRRLPAGPRHRADHRERGEAPFFSAALFSFTSLRGLEGQNRNQ